MSHFPLFRGGDEVLCRFFESAEAKRLRHNGSFCFSLPFFYQVMVRFFLPFLVPLDGKETNRLSFPPD